MKRIEPESIGDVLRDAISESQMDERLEELRTSEFWPAIIGREIAMLCGRPYIRDGKMTIKVPDASLRQELNMNRSRIATEFNRMAGKEVVKQLKFYY